MEYRRVGRTICAQLHLVDRFNRKSRVNGRFKDEDLAEILQNATKQVAGAFKARGIPEVMRIVEVLGIEQSRAWGVCSVRSHARRSAYLGPDRPYYQLNEFRKFMGLKRMSSLQNSLSPTQISTAYKTFKEWNPDEKIHKAAAALYKDIDRLELHVGLQAEEAKKPQPGAGLCPGFTISRAILADAVCLTRGDRFLTSDFTRKLCILYLIEHLVSYRMVLAYNLTAWGYQDCQYDTEDGSYGGLLTKLLFRTLPEQYPAGSALAHFPFHVPKKMFAELAERKDGSIQKYIWPEFKAEDLPKPLRSLSDDIPLLKPGPLESHSWKVVTDLENVKKILTTESKSFSSDVDGREAKVAELVHRRKGVRFFTFKWGFWTSN